MDSLKIVLLFLCSLTATARGYKILAIFTHDGKSHQFVFEPIIRQLVSRGHDLTLITHHGMNIKSRNFKQIVVSSSAPGIDEHELKLFDMSATQLMFVSPLALTDFGAKACHTILSHTEVQKLIYSNENFDLILSEMFNSECVSGFVDKFKAPLIGMSSTTLMPWHADKFGQPDNPSYIENNHLWRPGSLDFFGRVSNLICTMWYKAVYVVNTRQSKAIAEEYFKKDISDFYEITNNASLILVNSHFSLHSSRPFVPGIVEVGGIHIRQSAFLPRNIEKFINESTHGVIYFSLGSMIKGHTFPQDKREEFLRAFARLPQRVLWKWENETMPGKPDNVMIQKWMPQFDILSHPNVKAFISHGGLLGTTEAVHCGVPMVVMPQYGDQHTNAKAVEANGGGVILYLKEATEEKVYQSLKTVLDPEFKAKAEALSARFRDRPMSPMDTAIYWVEYVARHKGAPHLRTAAVDMPLYQYLLLDVIAFLLAIAFVLTYITYKTTCLIFRALIKKKKVKQN